MTIVKTLLAIALAGSGALAVYASDAPAPGAPPAAQHYPGVSLGTLFQPLEH